MGQDSCYAHRRILRGEIGNKKWPRMSTPVLQLRPREQSNEQVREEERGRVLLRASH